MQFVVLGILVSVIVLIVIAGIVGPPDSDTASVSGGAPGNPGPAAPGPTALEVAKRLKADGVPLGDIFDISNVLSTPTAGPDTKGATSLAVSNTTTSNDDNVRIYVFKDLEARRAAQEFLAKGNETATNKGLGVTDTWKACSNILYLRTTIDDTIKPVQVINEMEPIGVALQSAFGPCVDPNFLLPDG